MTFSLVPLENPILLSKLSESSGIVSLQLKGTKNATTSGLSSSHLGCKQNSNWWCQSCHLLIHLNVCLIVTVGVSLGAILHSVCYTDAVYSNNFERIYGSFSESINNLEISEQYWTNIHSSHPPYPPSWQPWDSAQVCLNISSRGGESQSLVFLQQSWGWRPSGRTPRTSVQSRWNEERLRMRSGGGSSPESL